MKDAFYTDGGVFRKFQGDSGVFIQDSRHLYGLTSTPRALPPGSTEISGKFARWPPTALWQASSARYSVKVYEIKLVVRTVVPSGLTDISPSSQKHRDALVDVAGVPRPRTKHELFGCRFNRHHTNEYQFHRQLHRQWPTAAVGAAHLAWQLMAAPPVGGASV